MGEEVFEANDRIRKNLCSELEQDGVQKPQSFKYAKRLFYARLRSLVLYSLDLILEDCKKGLFRVKIVILQKHAFVRVRHLF